VAHLYWSLSIIATIGGFLFGYDTSNIGSALTFIPYHLGSLALGYLVAGASLGAAVGAIASGPVTDAFGRKSLLIIDAGSYASGAIISAFTLNIAMLLIARTLIGVAIGADSAMATAYIAEYTPKDRRGRLSILQQWMITVGILAAYIVAIIIFQLWPQDARTFDWRLILGIGAVPAIIGLVFRAYMPESPRWLLTHGHVAKLQNTLEMLGLSVSVNEIQTVASKVFHEPSRTKILTPDIKRALAVASIFMVFQQITGINVPSYYGPKILQPMFRSPHEGLVSSTVSGIEDPLILAAVNIAATYIGFRYIDRAGRKSLSRLGYGGMAFLW
jgi:MFS family permease